MSLLLVGASPSIFKDCAMHRHDCYEVIVNVEGEGIAEIGGVKYPFSPGTVHIIPPNMPHRKTSTEGFRDMYFHTDMLRSVGKDNFAPKEPIFLTDDAAKTMEKILSVLLERYLTAQKSDAVTESLYDVLIQIIEEKENYVPPDPVVEDLIHTITVSYSDPEFQVTEVLNATGYSLDHIRKRFQENTGRTPNEYLKNVRLRYAKRLLTQREKLCLPIGEIALMCGYYDPAYFCRCFKKEFGVTPSAFAKK